VSSGAGDGNRIVSPIQKPCVLMALPPPSDSNGAKWSQIRYVGSGAPRCLIASWSALADDFRTWIQLSPAPPLDPLRRRGSKQTVAAPSPDHDARAEPLSPFLVSSNCCLSQQKYGLHKVRRSPAPLLSQIQEPDDSDLNAASYFYNFHQIKLVWRKRVGVERTN